MVTVINMKKSTCHLIEFPVPEVYKVKVKESEIFDKYLGLAPELKKLLNMKVTVTAVIVGAFGTVQRT